MESTMSENKVTPDQKPGFLSVVKSILAAGIGVQSDKNRQRDFEQGNPLTFIVGGGYFYPAIYSQRSFGGWPSPEQPIKKPHHWTGLAAYL